MSNGKRYRVGDRVRSIAGDWSATDNLTGTIVSIDPYRSSWIYEVTFDKAIPQFRGENAYGWWMQECELEAIK